MAVAEAATVADGDAPKLQKIAEFFGLPDRGVQLRSVFLSVRDLKRDQVDIL